MGSSNWNPFSTGSPGRRSSSSYRPGYASSSYSSSSRHHSSTSRYKRSPRDSYMQHLYKKLQHFLREIWRYAQRHPYKVFFMVIMPLVSGGVLHKLARQFGVNLPETGAGQTARPGRYAGSSHNNGGGYYGSQGYGRETTTTRTSAATNTNGSGGMMGSLANIDMQSVAGGIGGLASLASMASKFM
ncbi:prenylated rab acceptor 1 [Pyrenophora seminiperda CCB06]|uniref:Prenylated rab acceptor 1 n=1 Tax=Pyrenophora seminiperda CCB06 TaxID=1302712 RepID=A0A3M7MI46_9PLEO|nr:prenylated rab acceptor 1 [Pyrenophora seminiperda CCB06]